MKTVKLKKNHLIANNTSFLTQYLLSLGIEEKHLNSYIGQPDPSDLDYWQYLNNIEIAIRVAHRKLSAGAKYFIQVDSDTDGYTSGAILLSYLRMRFPQNQCEWRLHNGKEHGIIVDTVPQDCELVFIPDAGSNQFEEQMQLTQMGKTVIILDHHEVEQFQDTNAIIVNNQLSSNFKNKDLSGAGVVYMFITGMDELYYPNDKDMHKQFMDLTAIGVIADMMNMKTLGNNYLAKVGLTNIHNKFILELAKKQSRGIKDPNALTKIDVAFYIAPVINGCIRGGAPEDKEMVFRALSCYEADVPHYQSVWRGVTRDEDLYSYAVRLAVNAKSRQDSARKKAFEWICSRIKEKGWDQHNIIVAPLTGEDSTKVTPNMTGLVAMELVKEFNKPCLVLRETDYDNMHVFGGSGRNGKFYGLPNLKDFIHEIGVYYAEGHQNAFGAFLLPDEIEKVRQYADSHINPQIFQDSVYEVDYIFHSREHIDSTMLKEFARQNTLWDTSSIPAPLFAFEVNYQECELLFMGTKKNSIKLKHDGVDFVAFTNDEWTKLFHDNPNGHATIIGRPQLNEYNGFVTVQILIDDLYLTNIPTEQSFRTMNLI